METLTFSLKELTAFVGMVACVGIPGAILGLVFAGIDPISAVLELLERRR